MAKKPKPPGAMAWKALAALTDAEVEHYFRTIEGMDNTHAVNSRKFLRRLYQWDEARQEYVRVAGTTPRKARHSTPTNDPGALQGVNIDFSGINRNVTAEPEPAKPATPAPVKQAAPQAAPAPAPTGTHQGDAMQSLALALAPHMAAIMGEGLRLTMRDMLAEIVAQHVSTALAAYTPPAQQAAPAHLAVIRGPSKTKTVIEGLHHEATPKVLQLLAQGLNVMIVGPAGCGKTTIARSVAKVYKKKATIISLSAGMTEAQLLGRLLPLGEGGAFTYVESPFVKAYRTGGVILLDEMDAADSNLLLVLNAALENGSIEIEARAASGLDTTVERHAETVILAAANTWGTGADVQYVGRGALDAATLDRFYRVALDYDAALEAQLVAPEVFEAVTRIRRDVFANKMRRVVSTRAMIRASKAMAAGYTLKQALGDELASWTADERRKVSL